MGMMLFSVDFSWKSQKSWQATCKCGDRLYTICCKIFVTKFLREDFYSPSSPAVNPFAFTWVGCTDPLENGKVPDLGLWRFGRLCAEFL
jgi:hypothetical protein